MSLSTSPPLPSKHKWIDKVRKMFVIILVPRVCYNMGPYSKNPYFLLPPASLLFLIFCLIASTVQLVKCKINVGNAGDALKKCFMHGMVLLVSNPLGNNMNEMFIFWSKKWQICPQYFSIMSIHCTPCSLSAPSPPPSFPHPFPHPRTSG